jgi:regulatory protein
MHAPTLKKTKTPAEARAALMRLASRAEKSSGDARRLMRGWGVAPADSDRVLAELIEARFIDDARYAAAYTREKTRASGWGAHKIRAALAAKGIARETIADALDEHLDHGAQAARLEKLLARRREKVKAASEWEMQSKLTRWALAQGYDYETVAGAVAKILSAK